MPRSNPCFAGFPFRTIIGVYVLTPALSFDPCFAGFPFRTVGYVKEFLKTYKVSILVLLDFPFGRRNQRRQVLRRQREVSILVLLDFPFGPEALLTIKLFIVFQSLFCWISLSDISIVTLQCLKPRFNPCFAGFPFRTENHNPHQPQLQQFQSLFCWISLSDYKTHPAPRGSRRQFQSLFCWISLSDYSCWRLYSYSR